MLGSVPAKHIHSSIVTLERNHHFVDCCRVIKPFDNVLIDVDIGGNLVELVSRCIERRFGGLFYLFICRMK